MRKRPASGCDSNPRYGLSKRRKSRRYSNVLDRIRYPVLGETLRRLRPEIPDIEQRADLPARALGNDDGIWLRHRLQPCGEIGGLADDCVLLRRTGADQIANNDEPRGDADADLQPFRRL
jgi:hypothetical protein